MAESNWKGWSWRSISMVLSEFLTLSKFSASPLPLLFSFLGYVFRRRRSNRRASNSGGDGERQRSGRDGGIWQRWPFCQIEILRRFELQRHSLRPIRRLVLAVGEAQQVPITSDVRSPGGYLDLPGLSLILLGLVCFDAFVGKLTRPFSLIHRGIEVSGFRIHFW